MEQNLRETLSFALQNKAVADIPAESVNDKAMRVLCEEVGLTANSTAREIKAHANEAFALIEEVVDELLPKSVEDILGQFAEVKNYGRDDEVVFEIKNQGLRRARLSITKGARGGIYKAARLDNSIFQLPTSTYTVAVYVTLEDLILGRYSLSELMNNITQGFVELVYRETVEALRSAKTLAPAANHMTSQSALALSDVDKAVRIASAYGSPAIFGFDSALGEIMNNSKSTIFPNTSVSDVEDIRKYGHVTLYKGTPVIKLPNYLKDASNTAWEFDETDVFVLPTDAKPVKVAFKGDMFIQENIQPTGSEKWEAHKMMGVGLALANSVCVISIAGE